MVVEVRSNINAIAYYAPRQRRYSCQTTTNRPISTCNGPEYPSTSVHEGLQLGKNDTGPEGEVQSGRGQCATGVIRLSQVAGLRPSMASGATM